MALPFLIKKKDVAAPSVHVEHRKPDAEPDGMEMGLEQAAKDILSAIESKDARRLGQSLKAAFEICDSEPHVEGEHIAPGESE